MTCTEQVHALEHQLQESSSQRQVLQASHEQLQQQKDRLVEQLHKSQSECQSTKTHLEQRQTMFEQESSSLHSALSRHKEERATLERDKQALHSFVQELTKKAEVPNSTQLATSPISSAALLLVVTWTNLAQDHW